MTPARRTGSAGGARSRTFPPLPPRPGSRGPFAASWWGNAWVAALEGGQGAEGRLSRGRTYARGGAVGEITVSTGRVDARVQGSRRTPYRTSVALPQFGDADWDRLLEAVAAHSGHIAALLDRAMPPELAEDALAAGVPLFPRREQLEPSCSCPDWGHPCKHAAAVFYQVARLLDEDPFVLLLIRGRTEQEIVDDLQRRNAEYAAAEAAEAPPVPAAAPAGVPARTAFAAARSGLPPLPPPPPPVDRPGPVPVLSGSAEPGAGIDPAALEFLAADAAARAARLLADALAEGHPESPLPVELTVRQDTVRLAAAEPPPHVLARLAADATPAGPAALARAVSAWRYGGPAGLAVLDEAWTPAPAALARARDELSPARTGEALPELRNRRNHWTAPGLGVQLRLDPDGRWHPYRRERNIWWPAGPPDRDPAAALAAALNTPD
ncbi:SWIM zinc finger family protein [Peterkaempfera bronchialis]|uniref:SWIM-type domain-containing protein n=1 Tax=Peterkaempfera bronchialis TaxID=2126346 RepID=A0A345T1J9_9ACTN|nr:SWIM zinc finger family protein [Peterkaempfera bronchialis]AXI79854.1 hypothetical protein C7M71_023075 [Peterkaempfera bronchialis]